METILKISRAAVENLTDIQELYTYHLVATPPKEFSPLEQWQRLFEKIDADSNYHLLVGSINNKAVVSVTIIIIDNLTHNLQPYALIENVVTHKEYRNKGYASKLMLKACEIAKNYNCYKVMLMTGSKKSDTLNFYKNCGFNMQDKTAFIKWL